MSTPLRDGIDRAVDPGAERGPLLGRGVERDGMARRDIARDLAQQRTRHEPFVW
ncbi:MAG: hypothetical protein KDE27_14340 [Planctomycetes bacterium]|nr:hypothetical protein [Planctomycetota bacterium]